MKNKLQIAIYDSLMGNETNYNDTKGWWTIGTKFAFDEHSEGPEKIRWIFSGGLHSIVKRSAVDFMPDTEISVFTEKDFDSSFIELSKSKIKIAWIHECRSIHPWAYSGIIRKEVEDKFDYIITYDEELLKRGGKYVLGPPPASSCIKKEDLGIHPKNKFMSFMASETGRDVVVSYEAKGHFLRHIIADSLKKRNYDADYWGRAYNPFPRGQRITTLKDYYFSFAIMNASHKNYFTDILTDCFRAGTVPIFWGCENIGEFFNEKGIIRFETPKQLNNILSSLTVKDYYDRMEYIQENFETVKKYFCTDDNFVNHLIKAGIVQGGEDD